MLSGIIASAVSYKMQLKENLALEYMFRAYQYCEDVNPGNICMQGACKSEARFIYEVNADVNYFNQPANFPKPEFAHNDKDTGDMVFDFISECLVPKPNRSPGGGNGGNPKPVDDKQCCGPVPYAKIYNAAKSTACCVNINDKYAAQLYNTAGQCCSDVGVKGI